MKILVLAVALAAFAAGFAAAQQSELLAPMNEAVDAMLTAAGVPNREAARVVPVVGVGGVRAGFAQIVGSQPRVAAVRAVLRISATSPNGWTIDSLVPVSTVSRASGAMHRVYGVAVDALVNGE